MEENIKLVVLYKCHLNTNTKEIVSAKVLKLLDVGIIYPISDSLWINLVQIMSTKRGIIVVWNDNNDLIQRA